MVEVPLRNAERATHPLGSERGTQSLPAPGRQDLVLAYILACVPCTLGLLSSPPTALISPVRLPGATGALALLSQVPIGDLKLVKHPAHYNRRSRSRYQLRPWGHIPSGKHDKFLIPRNYLRTARQDAVSSHGSKTASCREIPAGTAERAKHHSQHLPGWLLRQELLDYLLVLFCLC